MANISTIENRPERMVTTVCSYTTEGIFQRTIGKLPNRAFILYEKGAHK